MRVLVVEDERAIAADLVSALSGAGYLADLAGDGEDAWFRAETEEYAALVLDLGLPRLDGLSVVRRLRAAGIATPILILTARSAWMNRVEGIDAGADDYLGKPFHIEELLARLGALIRRSGGHATTALSAGDILIDTRRMVVSLAGRRIAVSPLEFRLLRYLVHHKGRIVSQGELYEHIYAGDQEPGSNALEVLVGRLRRKLGPQVISTQRGYGYLVEDCA